MSVHVERLSRFLAIPKAKWKVQATGRERRRKLFGSNAESSQRSTVGGMIRKRAENIAGSNWEILEYKPDPSKPGDLKVYILAGEKVHSFNFHVPKRYMLHSNLSYQQRK